MATAIEDVSSLPGESVNDQDGRKIGEITEIFGVGDGETPMWVTIKSPTGVGRSRRVFVPIARLKRQGDEIRVPYSYSHIHDSPEVEAEDELSEEDDRALRSYYSVGLGDQEVVGAAQSYASQVPDEHGPAHKIDASAAEGPVREIDDTPPAERARKAYEAEREEQGDEHRKGKKTTADDVFEEDGPGGSDAKNSADQDTKSSPDQDTKSSPDHEDESAQERDD